MEKNNIVGKRIQDLRETKQISQEELAQNAGLSLEQIICIENNIVLPAVAHLLKISRALGVRLGTFLDDQEEQNPIIVRKVEEGNEAVSFTSASSSSRKDMDYRSLSHAKADRHMEPFMINISYDTQEELKKSSHEGEEFLYVLEGDIELVYGQTTYELKLGDSIYFDSIVPHFIRSNTSAKVLAVVYTPF